MSLTKSVLQALPAYVMQSILLPKSICDDIDKVCEVLFGVMGIGGSTIRNMFFYEVLFKWLSRTTLEGSVAVNLIIKVENNFL